MSLMSRRLSSNNQYSRYRGALDAANDIDRFYTDDNEIAEAPRVIAKTLVYDALHNIVLTDACSSHSKLLLYISTGGFCCSG